MLKVIRESTCINVTISYFDIHCNMLVTDFLTSTVLALSQLYYRYILPTQNTHYITCHNA